MLLLCLLLVCTMSCAMDQVVNEARTAAHIHTPLVQAALESDIALVSKLLDGGASIDEIAPSGLFPLHAAVQGPLDWDKDTFPILDQRIAVVKLLLSRGANFELKTTDVFRETVFHACTKIAIGGARKTILGSQMLLDVMHRIFLTQGPLAKAYKETPSLVISKEESDSIKRKVWDALLIKNTEGRTSRDLMCNHNCSTAKHYKCVATSFNEELVASVYDSALEDLQKEAKK